MNTIIVGCTKVGIILASELCRTGHYVAVVDRNAKRFCELPSFFHGVTVEGVALDFSVLEKAGIMECDALAAVTDDDNLNIVVAQLAKEKYKIPNVVTRISDPVRERVYQNSDLMTICPTNIESAGIFNMITGEAFDSLVAFGNRKARFVTRSNPKWIGKLVCDIPVFNGEMVYAVIDRDGRIELADDRTRMLMAGEMVIFSSLVD